MRRIATISALIMTISGGLALWWLFRPMPHAELLPERLNLGRIDQLEGKASSFALYNSGSRSLFISGISTSCSCITAEAPTGIVKPGKSISVQVVCSPDKEGEFRRTIYLYTNACRRPISMKVSGYVPPAIIPESDDVYLGIVKYKQMAGKQIVLIYPECSNDLRITKVIHSLNLVVDVGRVIGRKQDVRVGYSGKRGMFTGVVRFFVSNGRSFPVSVTGVADGRPETNQYH